MFIVDGLQFNLPHSIERSASLTASEVSGMLLNGQYLNDVIGTYMQYSVKIAVPRGQELEYTYLYEVLTNPVDAHTWVFPYNQNFIELTGKVDVINDRYYKEENGVNIWRGTTFTVTATHSSKEITLGEAIQRGLTPEPLATSPQIGDAYAYTSEGWAMVMGSPQDGDVLQYSEADGWQGESVENLDEVEF